MRIIAPRARGRHGARGASLERCNRGNYFQLRSFRRPRAVGISPGRGYSPPPIRRPISTRNVMLFSPAYAQAAGGAPGGFDLISLMPLVLIFVVFYFLLIRPQQKKMKSHRDMIGAVKRGDRVLTGGGIIGSVVKVEDGDDVLLVEIAKDIRVRVARSTISDVLNKPQAREAAQAKAEGGAESAPKAGLMAQLFGKK
jgi:preprotein translocase subunit YajC